MNWGLIAAKTNERKKPRLEALPLKESKRGFIAHCKHFTYKLKLVRSPYLGLLTDPFYSNKIKNKQEKQVNHTYNLIQVKIFMKAIKWNKEKIDIIKW